jgi:hypothetical protein
VRPRTTYVEASGSEDDEPEKAAEAAAPAPIKKRAIKTSGLTVKIPAVR